MKIVSFRLFYSLSLSLSLVLSLLILLSLLLLLLFYIVRCSKSQMCFIDFSVLNKFLARCMLGVCVEVFREMRFLVLLLLPFRVRRAISQLSSCQSISGI